MLETIYELAGVTPPAASDDEAFRGHPLAVPPRGAAFFFYGVWPALVRGAAYLSLTETMMKLPSPRVLSLFAVVLAAPLGAADLKVDLGKEQVGKPPDDLRADGRHAGSSSRTARTRWSRSTDALEGRVRTTRRACSSRARASLYGTSNEELMDNAKQFAYFPVAVLQRPRQLLERHDQREVQDRGRRRSTVARASSSTSSRTATGWRSATTTPRTTSRSGSSTTASGGA